MIFEPVFCCPISGAGRFRKFMRTIVILLLLAFSLHATASDSLKAENIRINRVHLFMGGSYVLSFTALYQLWYKDQTGAAFRFFNDNTEWLGMDKAGHFGTAWYLGCRSRELYQRAGMKGHSLNWLGTASGMFYLTAIELLDGFSNGWGFSPGDMLANLGGYSLASLQYSLWDEQRFRVAFSFSPGPWAAYRPDLLGRNTLSQLMKDYNAQTYWLAFSPASFFNTGKVWPAWLDLSLGYSVDGLLGGRSNNWVKDGIQWDYSTIQRRQEWLIGLDVNLQKIPIHKPWFKTFARWFGFIHIPGPAYNFSTRKFHPFYY